MASGWIENIFYKLNPEYRHRYEIYNELLVDSLSTNVVWLDIGCGRNEYLAYYGDRAGEAIGIDRLIDKNKTGARFLQADLRKIPLQTGYGDLITLRMVAEHLENIPADLFEVERLLRPGGKLIILTTNILSPMVFLPRLLPYSVTRRLIQMVFNVGANDIFPTHHRFNTPRKLAKGFNAMKLIRLDFLEQAPLPQPALTVVFGLWYYVTKLPGLNYSRSNLLAIFEKKEHQPL